MFPKSNQQKCQLYKGRGSKAVKIKHNNKLLSKEGERHGSYGHLWCEIGLSPSDGGAGE